MTKNKRRKNRAKKALLAGSYTNCKEGVIDLLTDLRHYCNLRKIDYFYCNGLSSMHYNAESQEEAIEKRCTQ